MQDSQLLPPTMTGQHLREERGHDRPLGPGHAGREYTLELRTRDRERKLLPKVEKSLKMIDDGSYGYCRGNQRADRHSAASRPTATLSLEAQNGANACKKLWRLTRAPGNSPRQRKTAPADVGRLFSEAD